MTPDDNDRGPDSKLDEEIDVKVGWTFRFDWSELWEKLTRWAPR